MEIILKRLNNKIAFIAYNEEGKSLPIDASSIVGGEGLGFRPMELLLSSLISCASIDIIIILRKMKIELNHFEIQINGIRKDATPSPFEKIYININIGENDPIDSVEKAAKLSFNKYCSVAHSLNPDIQLFWEIKNV